MMVNTNGAYILQP